MPLHLVRADLIQLNVDIIVNAANEGLQMGGGVCGAIFRAAGADKLQAACNTIGHCPTGGAVITPGFGLSAMYIIHTVGPVWRGGTANEAAQLRSCYLSSLRLAQASHVASIAFPLISSGIYGYPPAQALHVATEAISAFLSADDAPDMDVTLALFGSQPYLAGTKLFSDITAYIDAHYQPLAAYEESIRDGSESQRSRLASQLPLNGLPDIRPTVPICMPSEPAPTSAKPKRHLWPSK